MGQESDLVPMSVGHGIYTTEGLSRELRQGEIISNTIEYRFDSDQDGFVTISRGFVLVVTQDCDLLQDHNRREKGDQGDISGVILLEARPMSDVRPSLGGDIWRRVRNNKDERYQLLQAVPAELDQLGEGIPCLVIDFKKIFTLPILELVRQCNSSARRRARLIVPYREHLQGRLVAYLQRVGIPEPHKWPES